MSWWVHLLDPETKETVEVPHHEGDGGTYVVGGTHSAELNVTYNYGELYRMVWGPNNTLTCIDGMSGARASIPLQNAVDKLGTRAYEKDYWAPTPGNAGKALSILLEWAKLHPNAVFSVH